MSSLISDFLSLVKTTCQQKLRVDKFFWNKCYFFLPSKLGSRSISSPKCIKRVSGKIMPVLNMVVRHGRSRKEMNQFLDVSKETFKENFMEIVMKIVVGGKDRTWNSTGLYVPRVRYIVHKVHISTLFSKKTTAGSDMVR